MKPWLTRQEQGLILFLLALLIIGVIVQRIRFQAVESMREVENR
jgi:hypothetical protein